jgi:hypothetical protein
VISRLFSYRIKIAKTLVTRSLVTSQQTDKTHPHNLKLANNLQIGVVAELVKCREGYSSPTSIANSVTPYFAVVKRFEFSVCGNAEIAPERVESAGTCVRPARP